MTQNKIQLLPEHIIDQIKAGEVVERPSALLKELLENSIDAHSTTIEVTIKNGGLDLISIIDNGDGILFDDLPYAFHRHATSKISRFEDIYHLNSYGFRGEALASMASVSRVTCHSISKDNPLAGGKIIINGAMVETHIPTAGGEHGTSIYIKDLFFNTPARLKFIKSQTSEKNALKKILNYFLISNPNVKFIIKWDDEEKHIYPPSINLKDRISQTLLKNNSNNLFYDEQTYEGHTIKIFSYPTSCGNSSMAKSNTFFVNSRYFQDATINKIISQNDNKFARNFCYIVFIETPSEQIDVNIHPNKTQIKFINLPLILSIISGMTSKTSTDVPLSGTTVQKQTHSNHTGEFHNVATNTFFQKHNNESAATTTLNSELNFTKISNNFYITNFDSNFYLISKNELISYLFDKTWSGEKLNNDVQIIPLLISQPIDVLEEIPTKEIDSYAKLGFEFEKVSSNKYLLKSYPESLPVEVAKQFSIKLLQNKSLNTCINDQFEIYTSSIIEITSKNLNAGIKPSFIKLINDNLLEDIFNKTNYEQL